MQEDHREVDRHGDGHDCRGHGTTARAGSESAAGTTPGTADPSGPIPARGPVSGSRSGPGCDAWCSGGSMPSVLPTFM